MERSAAQDTPEDAPAPGPARLFVPGWGARAAMYRAAVPPGWEVLDPPTFRDTGGALREYNVWLASELDARGRSVLGGHSMGAALALVAAAERPERVSRLVLVSPCGFPLAKPVATSARDLVGHVLRGRFRFADVAVGAGRMIVAPRAAWELGSDMRQLDLSREMARIREANIPTAVIACATDTMVTTDHCRRAARILGASYREVVFDSGHVWMIAEPLAASQELAATLSG